jgi:hypothetical protein
VCAQQIASTRTFEWDGADIVTVGPAQTPVVGGARRLGSNRIRVDVTATIQVLERHQGYRPAQNFAAWSRRVLEVA